MNTIHEKKIVFCVALAAFTFQFEAFMVSVSLPNMASEMAASTTSISFVVLTYLLAASIAFLPAGHLANRFGLRCVFLSGCLIALVATLVCGVSESLAVLCVGRFAQGLGTGAMVAMGYAMIPMYVSQDRVGWGYGMLSLGAGLGMLIGLPIGGVLAYLLSWHWIFIGTAPLFGLLLYVGFKQLPRGQCCKSPADVDNPIDWIGLFWGSLLISSTVLSFSLGAELGWTSVIIVSLLSLSIFLAGLLIVRARRGKSLVSPVLLRNSEFLFSIAILFSFNFVNSGLRFLMPFYLEYGFGLSVLMSSILLLAYSVGFASTSTWSGPLTDRFSPSFIVRTALLLTAIICALYAWLISVNALILCLCFMLILGITTALFSPANNRLIASSVKSGDRAEASALIPIALNTGSLVGVSAFDTIFSLDFPEQAGMSLQGTPVADVAAQHLQLGLSHALLLAALILWFALFVTKRFIRAGR